MVDEDRLAPWARKSIDWKKMRSVQSLLRRHDLRTVCESARCPNQSECFGRGQATFLIMGDLCTRNCLFCSVEQGTPFPLDEAEPERVAEAARILQLGHVVITSVTRDDLEDGGAEHLRKTVLRVRNVASVRTVEVLTSDLGGSPRSLERILDSRPDVFNHNVETVPGLYPKVRPQASYERSLSILGSAARFSGPMKIKSGLMVGFGESPGEVEEVLHNLKEAGCHIVTIGQYLRPSRKNIPVKEYVPPERFRAYEQSGKRMGLETIASPFVRSSYRADLYASGLS